MSFSDELGNSMISEESRNTENRLIQVDGGLLCFWPSVALLILILGVVVFVVRRRS